jgi:Zn-dependent protease with chaperone function
MEKTKGRSGVEQRYSALRTIAGVLSLIGWIVVVLGFLGALGTLFGGLISGEPLIGFAAMFVSLLSTGLLALSIFASANSIKIIIDMEENTRRTYLMLEKLARIQMRSFQ